MSNLRVSVFDVTIIVKLIIDAYIVGVNKPEQIIYHSIALDELLKNWSRSTRNRLARRSNRRYELSIA